MTIAEAREIVAKTAAELAREALAGQDYLESEPELPVEKALRTAKVLGIMEITAGTTKGLSGRMVSKQYIGENAYIYNDGYTAGIVDVEVLPVFNDEAIAEAGANHSRYLKFRNELWAAENRIWEARALLGKLIAAVKEYPKFISMAQGSRSVAINLIKFKYEPDEPNEFFDEVEAEIKRQEQQMQNADEDDEQEEN